jgi:hypothetical protein
VRLVIVLWASLPAVLPLLAPGLPSTHDGLGHLFRLLDFDLTFRAGAFFPRLAPHLALDYGYGSFTFYPPASVYLGEAFRLLGLGYIDSLKACYALAILASALGAYLLARELYGWRGALVAAVAYVYLPYHLLDVYARGDVAEALALALTPLILWSFWRLARAPIPGRILAAGTLLGLLLVTHNLSAVIVAPVLIGFLVVAVDPKRPWPALRGIALAGALAVVLSAFYWLPTLGEIGSIDTHTLTTAAFDLHRSFIPPAHLVQQSWLYEYTYQPGTDASFNFGRAQVALLGLAALWVALARPRAWRLLLGAAGGIAVLAWLEQPGSTFLWDLVPPSRYLQFPYRLSADAALLSCLLIGGFAAAPFRPWFPTWRPKLGPVGALLGVVALGVLLRTSLGLLPNAPIDVDEQRVSLPMLWRLEADRGLIEADTQPDYAPKSVQGDFFVAAAHPMPGPPSGPVPRLTIVSSAPLDLTAKVEAPAPTSATFDWLSYPAWRASIDGSPVPIEPAGPLGLVRVAVPAGTHTLRLAASGTTFDELGLLLSGLGLVVVSVVALRRLGPHWPRAALVVGAFALVGGVGVVRQVQPAQPLAAGVDFARDGTPAIRLMGSELNRVNRTPDGALEVTLTWEALVAPLADCTVQVRLLDPAGNVVTGRDKVPLFALRPCETWQAGEIVRDEEQVRLPAGAAAGAYRLAVGISAAGKPLTPVEASSAVAWRDPGQSSDSPATGVLLGVFAPGVAPATPPPSDARALKANFAGRISLEAERVTALGPDGRPKAATSDSRFVARAEPGESVQVDLFWRSLADVSTDYSVFTHLVDASHNLVAQDDAWPDRFGFPTSIWSPGDARHDQYRLLLSPGLKPGIYTLVAGLYERPSFRRLPLVGGGGQDQAVLGTVKVSGPDRVFGVPVPLDRRDDVLGGQIALVGASAHPPSGGKIALDLAWRAVTAPRADYTVFVHVLDQDGRLVAQKDGPPLGGAYPTSAWDDGDTIYDHVEVPWPVGLPPGRYRVILGLYQLANGQRLATPDGQDSLLIVTSDA